MSRTASEVHQVKKAVCCSIPLDNPTLPDRFFPAHLSVALIDAIFRSRGNDDHTVPAARRYCHRFDIAQTCMNRWDPPAAGEQESLTDLIGRFDSLGVDRMIGDVFRTGQSLPRTKLPRAEYVLRAARELRRIGIEVLQDVQVRSREEIEQELADSVGLGASTIRMILIYTGNDEFVCGDEYVRRFVADAVEKEAVSAARAESLVRQCAYEMILSPRFLDYQIWSRKSAWAVAA